METNLLFLVSGKPLTSFCGWFSYYKRLNPKRSRPFFGLETEGLSRLLEPIKGGESHFEGRDWLFTGVGVTHVELSAATAALLFPGFFSRPPVTQVDPSILLAQLTTSEARRSEHAKSLLNRLVWEGKQPHNEVLLGFSPTPLFLEKKQISIQNISKPKLSKRVERRKNCLILFNINIFLLGNKNLVPRWLTDV